MDQRNFAEQLYDPRGSAYDNSHHPELAKWFVDHSNIKSGESVLDLACGTGLVTLYAADKTNGPVVGIDVSEGMLNEARTKSRSGTYTNVTFYNHDVADLASLPPIQGQLFDVITLCSAFVLLNDPVDAARSWLPYLSTGGRLVVDVVTPKSLPAGLAAEMTAKRLGVPVGYNTSWSDSEDAIRQVLEQAGYQVKAVVPKDLPTANAKVFDLQDVDSIFEQQLRSPAMQYLAEDSIREKARQIFKEIFATMAVDNQVKEQPSLWVATAIKP